MKKLPVQTTVGIALMAIFLTIVITNTRDIVFGAPLTIKTISNGMTLKDTYLTVAGIAPHAKMVSINGRNIYTNRKGEFSEPILLVPGYNILEIQMIDRFGNSNKKQYELVLSEEENLYSVSTAEKHY